MLLSYSPNMESRNAQLVTPESSEITAEDNQSEIQNAVKPEGEFVCNEVTISNNRSSKSTKRNSYIDSEDLEFCIKCDLTKTNIVNTFPGIEFKDVKNAISEKVDLGSLKFTPGEKQFIKDSIREGKTVDAISDALPLRSFTFVEQKYHEIEVAGARRTKFKNAQEKLIYEAKWTLMEGGTSSRSSRRSAISDLQTLEQAASQIVPKAPKRKLTDEELQKRRCRMEERREEKEKKRLQRIAEMEKRKLEKMERGEQKAKRSKGSSISQLQESSEYFQLISGDRKPIESGMQRRRVQPSHYIPEVTTKREPKIIIKTKSGSDKSRKVSKKLIHTSKEHKNESMVTKKRKRSAKDLSVNHETKKGLTVKIDKEKKGSMEGMPEQKFNPFDPLDINHDSYVSLEGRDFYAFDFSSSTAVPQLSFADSDRTSVMADNEKLPINDSIAVDIMASFHKSYRDLPTSFPPLMINSPTGERIINPYNRIGLRFLIYPKHYELYILASPKTNELNPIFEIIKLFQIHYSLYFSHSEKIKKIIMESYCKKLEEAVEENSFPDFMFVIDKWNLLMISLSPSENDVDFKDINEGIRLYLVETERKYPTYDDLSLDIFFEEIVKGLDHLERNQETEQPSPHYDRIQSKKAIGTITPPISSEDEKDCHCLSSKLKKKFTPQSLVSSKAYLNYLKPKNFIPAFFERLKMNKKMSRFCLHQVFLRVYSRIVSTDSRKLRSYKAFTAEVYGELLPSFTSEVLSKVNLNSNKKFYDLGSGVGNTTFQAALEFGAAISGGCELMSHASKLTKDQEVLLLKYLSLFGIKQLKLDFALLQSFVNNKNVRDAVLKSDILVVNNYLFDANLNGEVGRLLFGLKPGTKIISLKNFIRPRYKAMGDTVFDYLKVEKHEMSSFLSVSWTANKVPYYISTVQELICPEYL